MKELLKPDGKRGTSLMVHSSLEFSLSKASYCIFAIYWFAVFLVIVFEYQSPFLDEMALSITQFADPTNWYNASVRFRGQIFTIYAVTLIFVAVSLLVGFVATPSEAQLEKDKKVPIVGTFLAMLFCMWLLSYLLNDIGSNKYLSTEKINQFRYTTALLNNPVGISFLTIPIAAASVNAAYLFKRMLQKLKGEHDE